RRGVRKREIARLFQLIEKLQIGFGDEDVVLGEHNILPAGKDMRALSDHPMNMHAELLIKLRQPAADQSRASGNPALRDQMKRRWFRRVAAFAITGESSGSHGDDPDQADDG